MGTSTIMLAVNGERVRVPQSYSPSHRLIDVLRSDTRFTGPKVGCGEGGCGACTVLIDRFNAVTGVVSRATINSCLATIGSCDGASITTAEGLGNSKCGFHPVQEALAKHFASQCGYCTPGITVALAAAADRATAEPTAAAGACGGARASAIAAGLDGNLCRCTGWRPIIDAAREIADLEDLHKQPCCSSNNNSPCISNTEPSSSSSSNSCSSLLPPLASFPSWLKQHVAAQHSSSQVQLQQQLLRTPHAPAAYPSVPHALHTTILYDTPLASPSHLQGDAAAAAVGEAACGGGQVWLKPASLDQLAALLQRHCGSNKRARLVAGNTGAGVFKDLWPHDSTVVDLGAVAEMLAVTHLAGGVMLGAGLTMQQLISLLRSPGSSSSSSKCSSRDGKCSSSSSSNSNTTCNETTGSGSRTGGAADAPAAGVGDASHCQPAEARTNCAAHCATAAAADAAAARGAPCSTSGVWNAMADHLERIAGVHVRSAATLGGHFGLCAAKPLPSDLALVLAAAGAWLQLLTVEQPQEQGHAAAAAAAGFAAASDASGWQKQQQQQGIKLQWVTVEEFLEGSCIGAASTCTTTSSSSSSNIHVGDFITAEGVAGGKQLDSHHHHQQQQQQHMYDPCTPAPAPVAGPNRSTGYRVVAAVWLPYGNDSRELFWSYKVALRHANSHALVNAAAWFRFQEGAADSSSSSRNAAGADFSPFAGSTVTSGRLFVGFSPETSAAATKASAAAAAVDEEAWRVVRLAGAEQQLQGHAVDVQVVIAALRHLEVSLAACGAPASSFGSQALQGVLLKALVPLIDPTALPAAAANAAAAGHTASISVTAVASPQQKLLRLLQLPDRYDPQQLPQGSQVLPAPQRAAAAAVAPVHQAVEKDAVRLQASGEALFVGDVAARMRGRVLYLASVTSTQALASLQQLDASAALALPGVTGIITAADIPGTNTILGAPLLADGCVEYVGQPIALVAATSQQLAERAAALVCVTYGPPAAGRQAVITLDDAVTAGAWYDDLAPLMQVAAVKPGIRSSSSNGNDDSLLDLKPGASASDATGRLGGRAAAAACVEQLIADAPRQILGGAYDLPAQQHFYMETQVAVAEPQEDGCLRVTSATQSLDAVQQAVAAVLGLPFNKVAVVTKRLGGAFGGKASRSMPVAAAAALAATLFDAPVCYQLSRCDDFAQNGGRCAGRLRYDVGFEEGGKVLAIKAEVLLRAGAYLDLASNDGAQLLAASDSAYDLSGLHVAVKFARCNLPPHTIVRGPGYLQGVMVLEQILEHVAAELRLDPAAVKAANFLSDVAACSSIGAQQQQQQQPEVQQRAAATAASADARVGSTAGTREDPAALVMGLGRLCLGSAAALSKHTQQQQQQQEDGVRTILGRYISPETYTLPRVWAELLQGGQGGASYAEMLAGVQAHNREHAWSKRGVAVTPVRFDCSPAAVSAAISVYADGSVLVTHGGIEMGQGLSTKVKQAAVAALSQLLPEGQRPLPLSLVRLAPSSSEVVPGGGPSWSSTASEGNCQAVMNAAAKVVAQMAPYAQVGTDGMATWAATLAAICPDVGFAPNAAMLSAYGWFDGSIGSGAMKRPVQYSAFGAALSEVELDVLTGERRVLRSSIMYDCGYPLNPGIDLGQVEGAFVMGLGVMLSEDVQVQPTTGKLLSGTTWKYKIPHYDLIPQNFSVRFLSDAPNPRGILSSKASGEPALMASTSALMALQAAAGAAASEIAGLGLATAAQPALQLQQSNVTSADGSAGAGAGCVVPAIGGNDPRGVYDCTNGQVAGGGGGGQAAGVGWYVLSAPATPQKLKAAVGAFSVADALEASLAACTSWTEGFA